ncbi:MAG: phytase [Deltaproteobacteria bacterium]|nr:phytase [Deltaproteobacteria bacterium]
MSVFLRLFFLGLLAVVLVLPVLARKVDQSEARVCAAPLHPKLVTEMLPHDSDDPAIWINRADPAQSLVLGTDKNAAGGLYVFDLKGRIVKEKSIKNLQRPNNVDVEYGLDCAGKKIDIAVVTERLAHQLRIFRLPDMTAVDNGGLEVFIGEEGDKARDLMGIALYKCPRDEQIYAVVGRKTGPSGSYLWQYRLHDDGRGLVTGTLVRKFGLYSGKNEVEAIAVDDLLGYIYYADEGVGVRKYYADPERGDAELALFATSGFTEDHEGIAIYCEDEKNGYILVSDQEANLFHVFPRQGAPDNPHRHDLITIMETATVACDGCDATAVALGKSFPQGLLVAMSDNSTFQFYNWKDIAGRLKRK